MICKACAWAADALSERSMMNTTFDELWDMGEGHPECKGGTHCDCQHGGRPLASYVPRVITRTDGSTLTLGKANRCRECSRALCVYPNGNIVMHKRPIQIWLSNGTTYLSNTRCSGSQKPPRSNDA